MDGMQGSLGEGQLGSGLAQNAAILNQFRQPYMQMAQQMMEQGQEPPPFEQWASQQAQAQQPAPQDRRGMLSQLIGQLRQ